MEPLLGPATAGVETGDAGEGASAAQRDMHFVSLPANTKEDILHGLARTRSLASFCMQVAYRAPRLLVEWLRKM